MGVIMSEAIDHELATLIFQVIEIRERKTAELKNDGMSEKATESKVSEVLENDPEF